MLLIATNYRGIVTSIAEMEQSCDEIQLANEHGDKHAIVVFLCQFIIQGSGCEEYPNIQIMC